jgi:steroid delta-isomerase-like uncharacterized protein
MSVEENKAAVRRFAREVVNRGDFAAFEALVAPDFVEHSSPPGVPPTREALRHFIEGFRAAFPDLETTEEDLVAEGDKVVYRGTIRGTHRGELMGVPPTGKRIEIGEIQIQRLAGGKLAEHWGQLDWLALLQQLGAMPAAWASGHI